MLRSLRSRIDRSRTGMDVAHLALASWLPFFSRRGEERVEERFDDFLGRAVERLLEEDERLALEDDEGVGPGVGGQSDRKSVV